MTDPSDPVSGPAAGLLAAMGGAGRIRSVRTFVRETVRVLRRGDGRGEAVAEILTYRAAGGRVRIETFDLRSASLLIVPPAESAEAAEALREARLEPRTLLAHLHERRAEFRTASGGFLELALLDEDVLYLFDPRTNLCAERTERRSGRRIRYREWRPIGGIATPFLEIADGHGQEVELHLLGAAYDLPLPDSLFTHAPGTNEVSGSRRSPG